MPKLHVECFDTPQKLSRSILDFWAAETRENPMRSPDWLLSWFDAYHAHPKQSGAIYVVMMDDTPIALAPFYLRSPLPGIRSLRLMGDKGICSDHSSLIILPQFEALAIAELGKALSQDAGRQWDTICFDTVDSDDRQLNHLMTHLNRCNLRFTPQDSTRCWIIDLPSNWEKYLLSISKNHRKRCRRWQKDYFDTGRAKLLETSSENWHSAWNRLIDLNRQRRSQKNDKSAFDDPAFLAAHQKYLRTAIHEGLASIRELHVDGSHVASEYVLFGQDTIYCYQSGMLTIEKGDGYGNLSTLALIRDAIERGMKKVDFLRGDESYKQHWGATAERTTTWRASVPSISGNLYRSLRSTVDMLRDARSLLVHKDWQRALSRCKSVSPSAN